MHIRKEGREKYVWKTIGKPDEFSESELRKLISNLLEKINNIQNEEKKTQLFSQQEQKKAKDIPKSPSLGEIIKKFLEWYRETREPSSYRRHKKSSLHIIKFFGKKHTH